MTERVGNQDDAYQAVLTDRSPDGCAELVGSGEDRRAYLVNGIVYKVGDRPGANRYDHEILTAARRAGLPWAPVTTLYEITDWYGDEAPVLAMPYLVDDGSDPDPAALAAFREQTGGTVDRGNYAVISGQPVVVDGCTVSVWP